MSPQGSNENMKMVRDFSAMDGEQLELCWQSYFLIVGNTLPAKFVQLLSAIWSWST
jgi:hypothetical protein